VEVLSKKQELMTRFEQKGHDRVVLKWIPKNPYGKRNKNSGWIYKLAGDLEWHKLGNNFEDALKEIEYI
jgi:hypothetical protein|tara:strand:- start:220 stop:426 length:207 start_codon:yes stop_codon:yes gene_type:complete